MIKADVLREPTAVDSCGVCKGTAVAEFWSLPKKFRKPTPIVMTGSRDVVEIQATAEKIPFSEDQFAALVGLARKGIEKLVGLQKLAVA